MVKINASLHEHLRTSSRIPEGYFNRVFKLANDRLGKESIFGFVDFDDKRYKKLIGSKGYDRDYIGEDRRATRVLGVTCVHGEEVPTKQGHLLVFGLGHNIHLKHGRELGETIKEARDYNLDAVIIPDHLFWHKGLGNYLKRKLKEVEGEDVPPEDSVLAQIDAIEGFNSEACFGFPVGPFPFKANKNAVDFYRRAKEYFPYWGFICSGDGHSLYEFCRTWNEIDSPNVTESEEIFSESFRKSVQSTNEESVCRKACVRGLVGAVDHIIDLGVILGVAPRIKMNRYFDKGVERPNNK